MNIIIVAEGAIDMDGNAITCEDIKKVMFNIKVQSLSFVHCGAVVILVPDTIWIVNKVFQEV